MKQAAKKWRVEIYVSGVRKPREIFRGRVRADTPEEAIHLVATQKYQLWGGRVRAELEEMREGYYVVHTFIGSAPRLRYVAQVAEIKGVRR